MKLLESKVAIITGGSRGIGKSICETFAQNGCNVAFTYYNSKESAESLAKELNGSGIKVKATLHPFWAKVSQIDLPIPLLPPVIIATFDSSSFII